MQTRIFIYDDSQERRESLKVLLLLDNNLIFVGEAENCANVLFDIETNRPDVVLMDINMPLADGLQGLKKIKTQFPEVNVLMQTAFDDSEKIFDAICNGASGYILKSDNPLRIIQAIEEAMKGCAIMNPAIANNTLKYFNKNNIHLLDIENKVLSLISEGFSYKMVAEQILQNDNQILQITNTICKKLHISNLGKQMEDYYKSKE